MHENERLKKVIFWLISQGMAQTQEDVANKIGINPGYLSQLVSGIRPISNKFIKTLCRVFDKLNSNYVLSGIGEISDINEMEVKPDALVPSIAPANAELERIKGAFDQLKESCEELKRENKELIREASKWQTIAQQSQVAGPAWDTQRPLEKTG